MKDAERLGELVAKVANGEDLALDESDSSRPVENIKALAQIAAVYRRCRDQATGDSAPEPATLFTWGHLKVREPLGAGGFGDVYRAYDSVLDRDIALKLGRPDQSSPAESRAFIEEARWLARVRHANVLAVHGADLHQQRVGLWVDLLDGQTLEESFRCTGPIQSHLAITIALDLASALHAIHQAGLVHGDVKSANVMSTTDGRHVLMDFGAGSDRGGAQRAGTPLVMAPELFDGVDMSPASDLYSLGVMLYRLLTGNYPITGESETELRRSHGEAPPRLSISRPDLPRGLCRIIEALLNPHPSRRPSSRALLQQLNHVLETPRRRARTLALSTIFSLLLLGIGVSGIAYWHAQQSQRESEAVNRFLTDILSSPRPNVSGKNTRVLEVLQNAAERISTDLNEQPLARARVLDSIGKSFLDLGAPESALPLLREGLGLRQAALGPSHPQSLATQVRLGTALGRVQRHQEAEVTLGEAYAEARSTPSDALIADAAVALAEFHSGLGDFVRAESLSREALDLTDGRSDPFRFHDFNRLVGNALVNQGRLGDAEPRVRQSLEWAEHHHAQSALTLDLRDTLVLITGQTDRLNEAEALARHNLDVASTWLGDNDPYLIQAMRTLDLVLFAQDRLEEALELSTRAVDMARAIHGPEDWATLTLESQLANRLFELDHLDRAETLYLGLIERTTRAYSAEHWLAHYPRVNLTSLYLKSGQYPAGLAMARESLPILKGALGEEHLETLRLRRYYGTLLGRLGDTENARSELEKTVALAEQILGEAHEQTLKARVELQSLLVESR